MNSYEVYNYEKKVHDTIEALVLCPICFIGGLLATIFGFNGSVDSYGLEIILKIFGPIFIAVSIFALIYGLVGYNKYIK